MNFNNLHNQDKPLLIANVWDVQSAKIAEELNFKAIGTSSTAITSMLGYQDGEEISFLELEYIVKRIISNTKIRFSVDLESGYNRNPDEIVNLSDLGVVGINIEESFVDKTRSLQKAEYFSKIISEIKQ